MIPTGIKAVSSWRNWTDLHNRASTSIWSGEGPCRSMRTACSCFVREDAILAAQSFDMVEASCQGKRCRSGRTLP